MKRTCFVIQPFDGSHYDNLFEQVYSPAIKAAGFDPYRVDRDPAATVLIDTIEKRITESDAVFAEISEDNPNIWYELGFARSQDKPLCMVCSKGRRLPFDIQHRRVIFYPEKTAPSDYEELGRNIKERFQALVSGPINQRESLETVQSLNSGPATNGLRQHEIQTLAALSRSYVDEPMASYALTQAIERQGYNEIAGHIAVAALAAKRLVKKVELHNDFGNPYTAWQITEDGIGWLISNQHVLALKTAPGSSIQTGISDDDIPF